MAPLVQPIGIAHIDYRTSNRQLYFNYKPVVEMAHLTPASLACPQLWFKSYEQLKSPGSFPVHMILLATIGPVPWPKAAAYIGVAAACIRTQSFKVTHVHIIMIQLTQEFI